MKAIYLKYGEPPRVVSMQPTDMAYVGGLGDGSGYQVVPEEDFETELEWFSFHISMALYEGGEGSGSYDGWSWAILPETQDEAEHLAEFTHRTLFWRR